MVFKPNVEEQSLTYLREISKKNKLISEEDLSVHYENKSSIPIKPIGLNILNPEGINKNNKIISFYDEALNNDQEKKICKIIYLYRSNKIYI